MVHFLGTNKAAKYLQFHLNYSGENGKKNLIQRLRRHIFKFVIKNHVYFLLFLTKMLEEKVCMFILKIDSLAC